MIDMGVDREIPAEEVAAGWAAAFAVPVSAVAVTEDWGAIERWVRPGVALAVGRFPADAGEFPMTLTLNPQDEALEKRLATDAGTLEVIQRFCATVGCRAITGTDADADETWTLVTPTELWRIRGYDPDDPYVKLADAILEPLKVAVA